jgi:hypothetical protein
MQKVRLFAKCFKTWYNCRVWINPNFKLDFFPKVLTNSFKTTSTGVVDTGGASRVANVLVIFENIIYLAKGIFRGPWEDDA